MHVVTMLSYANSMLNPLLYAAFNENFRVGFSRACRCLTGRAGAGGMATGRGGGQLVIASNATNHGRPRPLARGEDRKPVTGVRLEVVEVAVSCRTAATAEEVLESGDVKQEEDDGGELDVLIAEPCSTSVVVVADCAVNTNDRSVEETPL